jgi:hypothetical protein
MPGGGMKGVGGRERRRGDKVVVGEKAVEVEGEARPAV